MLFRNVRFSFSDRDDRFRRLDIQLNVHRMLDVLLIVSSIFILLFVLVGLYNYMVLISAQRNGSRRNGRIVQFFFLGTNGQSLREFINLFDPDTLPKIKGDKIQVQEKIRWKDYLGLGYRCFMFLFSFSWLFFAQRSVWRCMEDLTARICSFFCGVRSMRRRLAHSSTGHDFPRELRMINLT